MKKTLTLIAVSLLMAGTTLTSCTSSSEDLKDAENKVDDAEDDLELANEELADEIAIYKKEASEKLNAHNQSLIDFNKRIATEKNDAKADYNKKIADLDKKNSDLKKRMEDYDAEGKTNWEKFKTEFNRDMDLVGTGINDLFSKDEDKK